MTLFALAGATLGATAIVAAATASAASLPPVAITYSGKVALHVFPTIGEPAESQESLDWTATANSGGSDGPLALDFASVTGSASIEKNGNCYDSTSTFSLASGKNPVAGGWFLNESSDYPNKGWKYIVTGIPDQVPVSEAFDGKCGSYVFESLKQTNELLQTQETFTPAQLAEWEATLAPLEFTPGKPATRTRTFSFDGVSHCTCYPGPTHIIESVTFTVSATSPAPGNVIKTEPAPGTGGGSPKGTPPRRKRSESLRKAIKEQAQEDLVPALEAAWKAQGLFLSLGLTAGVTLSNVLDELGQDAARIESESATARVINDYRIIKDPPDRRFHQLAKPHRIKGPVLPSCTAVPTAEQTACTSLRAAEMAMLISSGKAVAITDALLVTIDRDSTAIRARDYSAAQNQYAHFRSLHSELRRVLKSKGSSGARVAAVLRGLGVSGVLSSAQATAAINAVEAKLSRVRISAAKLGTLAKGALEARETDVLESLAGPNG